MKKLHRIKFLWNLFESVLPYFFGLVSVIEIFFGEYLEAIYWILAAIFVIINNKEQIIYVKKVTIKK